MDEEKQTAATAQESDAAESKQTQRINRWLNIIEIIKEILTCLKH